VGDPGYHKRIEHLIGRVTLKGHHGGGRKSEIFKGQQHRLLDADPLMFFLTWARLMKWTIPEQTDLVLYFGRCLGSLALVLEYCTYQAANTGIGEVLIYQFWIGICAFMVVLHIYGAIKKIQPITETLEIGLWVGLLFLSLAFYPI
jgi:hypothetical protein